MAAESAPSMLWHVDDGARGCIKSWDRERAAVFYAVRTGDTHLIDALALELHDLLLADGPMSESSILQALHDVVVPGREAEAASELHEHLLRLQGFGLLRELPA